MIVEFRIEETDFLDFQLFTASKSERINRKKRNGWAAITLGSLVIAAYFYLNQDNALAMYFGLVAVASAIFYPKYFIWRYKSHYTTYIRENYSKRFGQLERMEISTDFIVFSDKTGEGKVKLSEIETVNETARHFFIAISTGGSIIIPKSQLDNPAALKATFTGLGLNVKDETNWRWR